MITVFVRGTSNRLQTYYYNMYIRTATGYEWMQVKPGFVRLPESTFLPYPNFEIEFRSPVASDLS